MQRRDDTVFLSESEPYQALNFKLRSVVLCHVAVCCVVLCHVEWRCVVVCCVELWCVALWCVDLLCVALRFFTPCCVVLCGVKLCVMSCCYVVSCYVLVICVLLFEPVPVSCPPGCVVLCRVMKISVFLSNISCPPGRHEGGATGFAGNAHREVDGQLWQRGCSRRLLETYARKPRTNFFRSHFHDFKAEKYDVLEHQLNSPYVIQLQVLSQVRTIIFCTYVLGFCTDKYLGISFFGNVLTILVPASKPCFLMIFVHSLFPKKPANFVSPLIKNFLTIP